MHDVDSLTLASAKVAITGGFDAANDSLRFVNQHGITGSYDSATGVLTLSGVASVADYQAALASVTFGSTTTQPSGSRIVQWTVDDGSAQSHQSLTAATTLTVNGIILPPHLFPDHSPTTPPPPNVTLASLVVDGGRSFEPSTLTGGDHFDIGGAAAASAITSCTPIRC